MATVLHPGMRDMFGGPAGNTQNSVQMIMQGILQGMEKKRQEQQNQQLSSLFSNTGQSQKSMAGEGYAPPPNTPMDFVENILSNPNLDMDTKQMGLKSMALKSGIESDQAYAENLRRPAEPKREPTKEIEYWTPDGSKGSKILVSESQYNAVVEKLEDAGYTVQKPKEESKETSEFERLVERLEKSKKITPEKKNELIGQRLRKLIESDSGGDSANQITLGDGQKITLAELRAQYREKYNIPDEFELQMMELNPDPMVRQQAKKLKAEAAGKPSLAEFTRDVMKNGLEGMRPGAPSVKSEMPALPPGFEMD